ncbi:L-rhamnonate dehydratase [Paenibacillus baekrokdamisoli]|uniref:L-rhamnonate dehydratase n=1 Tax=Paenibacillus baekrokdamisoli TaxID=1712516 RepID=A0A3G9IVY9_9BACL|nr:enolase C-terminal domain-like protein [Paenibacillus baekrokdamisoli]MBB3072013.1 L-rhamnonate dehydratase [Paenibacillus baekrokdamisoli]BBH20315.1 L-rhamnonate dehydratase [Paenibacillus baekrokdamisoli]
MKITRINVYVTGPQKNTIQSQAQDLEPAKPNKGSWLSETVIANPMSIYPEYFDRRSLWTGMGGRTIVQIETDTGVTGLGESAGGRASAVIIKDHLSGLLIGKDPRQVEKLWDIMFRSSLTYGRKGSPIMAISAVDLALWDLIAKARNEPLYQTLGGAVKDKVQAYVTGNDFEKTKERGFLGQKLAMPYGPVSGKEGMDKNVELVRKARETLGPDKEIMLDCFMAWNVEYTIRMAELVAPYRVKWIEESLPPDDYVGYGIINRKVTSSAIATGEHEYTRFGFQQLLDARAAEILQPDICWCGGISEVRKICALASAQHIPVIPHAGGLQPWALHYIFAEINIPYAEFAYIHGADVDNYDNIFTGVELPQSGWFSLPTGIGAGIELRENAHDYLYEV